MSEMEPCPNEHSPGQVHGAQGHTETRETSEAPSPALPPLQNCCPPGWFPGGSRLWVAFRQRFCSAAITLGCFYSDEMPLDSLPHPPVRLPKSERRASGACGAPHRFIQVPWQHCGH